MLRLNRGRAWRIPVTGRAITAVAALFPGWAEAACRLALVLALDVSGSVDETEYRHQLDGIAEALLRPDVSSALLAVPDAHVSLAIFEWSSGAFQRDILGWTDLTDRDRLNSVAAHLREWSRQSAPGATGLGAAMARAGAMLGKRPDCWRRVLDVSGDGENNDWPRPRAVRAAGALGDATVNALVILSATGNGPGATDELPLVRYFRTEVLQGRDAFVEEARGYGDYARAMARKLLRETEAPRLGSLSHDPDSPAGPPPPQ